MGEVRKAVRARICPECESILLDGVCKKVGCPNYNKIKIEEAWDPCPIHGSPMRNGCCPHQNCPNHC